MTPTTLSAWAAKRACPLNRYYTRDEVGLALVSELGDEAPNAVIDLGAGEGSLSAAVVRRWPETSLTTVDIDKSCMEALHDRLVKEGARHHEHVTADVLRADLPARLDREVYDLAVCNPPFFRPLWDRQHADILKAAEFAEACPSTSEATAEVLFFAQNLRLVREGGSIALIVPNGMATSWRYLNFRKALLSQHTLRSVVQLPPDSFTDTEAYCFVLIVRKGSDWQGNKVKLVRLDEHGVVSDPLWIDREAAVARLDWSYHNSLTPNRFDTFTLRELGADVRRGSLSSVERRAASYPVFHTGDFPSVGASIRWTAEAPPSSDKLVIAEQGDILMARVDRDLHQKIAMLESGPTVITDCIYRVRLPKEHRLKAFEALVSEDGRARLQAATKGVGARLLGKGDLLDLPLSACT